MILRQLTLVAVAALAGCAHEPTLAGRIWDTRAGAFIPQTELVARAERAQHLILGETHDNAEHHRLQLAILRALGARPRLLAMEQLDTEHQAALDASLATRDAEKVADAGRFDRRGWNWPLYKPLVEFALERGWPIAAANLSRTEARAIVTDRSRSGLAPASDSIREALERDLVEGHCGSRPEPARLAGMVEAQRARDARLASVLKGDSVLIAGRGHARRDRGVPVYLRSADVLSIGFTEIEAGKASPRAYDAASFDYLWFTSRAPREDPCAR